MTKIFQEKKYKIRKRKKVKINSKRPSERDIFKKKRK